MTQLPCVRLFTPRPLDPLQPDGFAARWFHFARALSQRWTVEIVAVRDAWHQRHVEAEHFRPPLALRRFETLDAASPSLSRRILGTVDARRLAPSIPGVAATLQPAPDLAVFFQHFLAPVALDLPRTVPCVFVLEEDMVGLHRANRLLDPALGFVGRAGERVLAPVRDRRFGRLVAAAARRGTVVAISEAERAVFGRWTDPSRIVVIPNGVDPDYFAPRTAPADHDVGVFGHLGHPRNYVPIRNLVEAARDRGLRWRWLLAGSDPHASLRALEGELVTVVPDAADLRPLYARASVVIVPAEVTAGSKSTLLKAWAMARPVVATPGSAVGAPAHAGRNIVIAPPAAMLDAVSALLQDRLRAGALAAAGRATVVESCDVRVHAERFAELCARVAGRRP